jgi:hypothetical protein
MREIHGSIGPEPIDVDGAWWCGFYQGWRDRADGRERSTANDQAVLWSVGYRDGWLACACDHAIGQDGTWWEARSGQQSCSWVRNSGLRRARVL